MPDLAARVTRLRKEAGLSRRALSLKIGKGQTYAREIEERRTKMPSGETLANLASVLGTTPEYLLNGESGRAEPDSLPVPVFDVRAAAGDGSLIDAEHQAGSLTFDRAYLRKMTSAGPERLAIIQVWGDSMAPTIPEGAWAMIDQTQRMPINRGIYAFRQDDDARVKRILMDPTSGRMTLHSDNPAWEAVVVDAPESLDIIGRVIWFSKKLT